MKWPTIEQFSAMTPLPDGYSFERLKRADIPALIEAIKAWHPDIAVGGGSCYLREDFYTEHVCLDGESEKNILVALFRYGDEMAGMRSWEQEPDALTLYARLIIIAPSHRSAKLASTVMPLAETAGRLMGAEFFFGLATLKIPHMQHALERGLAAHRLYLRLRSGASRSRRGQARVRRRLYQSAGAGRGSASSRPGQPDAAGPGTVPIVVGPAGEEALTRLAGTWRGLPAI
ncbi:MAG: hypothetical protein ABI831_21040 [Betaproteobacteria bacterium]